MLFPLVIFHISTLEPTPTRNLVVQRMTFHQVRITCAHEVSIRFKARIIGVELLCTCLIVRCREEALPHEIKEGSSNIIHKTEVKLCMIDFTKTCAPLVPLHATFANKVRLVSSCTYISYLDTGTYVSSTFKLNL